MATKTRRPTVPEAVALHRIERQVSKAKPELQPELRAALRRALTSGGHLEAVVNGLEAALNNRRSASPEDALPMLAYSLEDLASLLANIQSVMAAGPQVGQRARTPHGRAEGVA
jgi:hypothetical protein